MLGVRGQPFVCSISTKTDGLTAGAGANDSRAIFLARRAIVGS
jgi:hypothetical protein